MTTLTITGYENDCNCEHCGRVLVHGVRLEDGRLVGAQCLNKTMTKPRARNGKAYRVGAQYIVKMAKVAQFSDPARWAQYGVSQTAMTFEAA